VIIFALFYLLTFYFQVLNYSFNILNQHFISFLFFEFLLIEIFIEYMIYIEILKQIKQIEVVFKIIQ